MHESILCSVDFPHRQIHYATTLLVWCACTTNHRRSSLSCYDHSYRITTIKEEQLIYATSTTITQLYYSPGYSGLLNLMLLYIAGLFHLESTLPYASLIGCLLGGVTACVPDGTCP